VASGRSSPPEQAVAIADRRGAVAVSGTGVGAVPVDHHRRRHHQPADAIATLDHRLQQGGGPARVHVDGLAHVHHGLPVANHATQVEHAIYTLQRAVHREAVAQVADLDLGIRVQLPGQLAAGVGQGVEVVQHPHALPRGQEGVDQVRAHEPRAAGDQDDAAHQTV
jgi:hypothetical protein